MLTLDGVLIFLCQQTPDGTLGSGVYSRRAHKVQTTDHTRFEHRITYLKVCLRVEQTFK